jgi:hypothetical protein
LIARIPSEKEKKFMRKASRYPEFHCENKEEVVKKGSMKAQNPIHEGIPIKKAGGNNKLWPKIPSTKELPPKRLETTISCGLKSHPRRDSHRKGSRQQ